MGSSNAGVIPEFSSRWFSVAVSDDPELRPRGVCLTAPVFLDNRLVSMLPPAFHGGVAGVGFPLLESGDAESALPVLARMREPGDEATRLRELGKLPSIAAGGVSRAAVPVFRSI